MVSQISALLANDAVRLGLQMMGLFGSLYAAAWAVKSVVVKNTAALQKIVDNTSVIPEHTSILATVASNTGNHIPTAIHELKDEVAKSGERAEKAAEKAESAVIDNRRLLEGLLLKKD